jgi:hypothetical protein
VSEDRVKQNAWKWTAKKEAAALALAQGLTWRQIHEAHGIAAQSLADYTKVAEFQARIDAHMQEMTTTARRILQRNAEKAAQQIVDVMTYGNVQHTTRLAAAKDILDRVGLKSADKIQHSGNVLNVTPDDLAKLSDEELDELARKSGLL